VGLDKYYVGKDVSIPILGAGITRIKEIVFNALSEVDESVRALKIGLRYVKTYIVRK
jgi:hypothetical protein